jgi:hypothetical protein
VLRNFIGFIAGLVLSYLLIFLGWRLAWLLIVGHADRSGNAGNAGTMITLGVVLTAIVAPAVSVVVAAVVASIAVRSGWWLGGVAIVPLLIHGLIRNGAYRPEVTFSVVCIALAFAAAFAISRFKSRLLRRCMPNKSLHASRGSVFRMRLL